MLNDATNPSTSLLTPTATVEQPGRWLLDALGRDDVASDAQWFVLQTRSRQEKAVCAQLQAVRASVFLPLVTKTRYYGRSKQQVGLPLFPNYVFLFGLKEQAYAADRNKRLVNILPVRDQEHLDWELRNLHLALAQEQTLDPYPYLKVGVRVEVRSGPCRGLQGLIEKRGRADRLILQVDMLGRAMSMEIDASLLDPIE